MPTNLELLNEAEAFKNTGKNEEAVAKLKELLAQDDKFVLAHATLAVLYTRLKKHDLAIAHAETVCQLEPNDPFNYSALSVTCQRAGKILEAEDAMARARAMQG